MRAHPGFTDVKIEFPLVASGRRLRVDILCSYENRQLLIETKTVAPLIQERVHDYIDQLRTYGEYLQSAELILAVPDEISDKYKAQFQKAQITVWDGPTLLSIFRLQLDSIADSQLYEVLNKYQGSSTPSLAARYIDELSSLPRGRANWSAFQRLCVNILEYVFTPPLEKPIYELSDEQRINRRDIIIPNYVETGFWGYLRGEYKAHYIVIDAKNYVRGIEKGEVLQVANYLKDFGAGLFGIICGRTTPKTSALLTRHEQWVAYRKLIIFLTDDDLIQMLIRKQDGSNPEDVIKQRVEQFRLSL
jgi:hypothetical protein